MNRVSTTPQRTSLRVTQERAGTWQAIASEWTKFHTVRSTIWTLVAMALVTVGTAALVAATDSLQPTETILAGSLGNAVVGQLAAAALGALVVCGEYASGTIRATFAACPRRITVLAAKTVVVAVVVYGTAFAAAGGAYLTGAFLLDGRGHPAGEPMPALAGVAVSYAAVGVLGVAVGTIVRHTAGALTALTAMLLGPLLLGPLLGAARPWLTGTSAAAAMQKLAGSADATTLGGATAWPTLWLVCGYSLAALLASAWLLHRRDT